MDFGLSKYLEMFEARFGHPAATCLIVFMTLMLIAFGWPPIWHNLCLPLYALFVSISTGNAESFLAELTWRDVLSFISTGIVLLLFVGIFLLLFTLYFNTDYQMALRRMDRLRAKAMTGKRVIPNRVALRRRQAVITLLLAAFAIAALIYAGISATKANKQMAAIRPEIANETAKLNILKPIVSALERNQDIIDKRSDIVAHADETLISDYVALCHSTKDKTCEATLVSVLDKRTKSLQALPPLIRVPRLSQAKK